MIAIRKHLTYEGRRDPPTPKEIRRSCEEIQATWSPRERARRYRGPGAAGWTPPMIGCGNSSRRSTKNGPAVRRSPGRSGRRRIAKRAPWLKDSGKACCGGCRKCTSNWIRRTHVTLGFVVLGLRVAAIVLAFLFR